MRLIPASLHRILDFSTVALFAAAPSVLDLRGFAAVLSYALAIVHLAMTLLTRFSPADRSPVSFGVHRAVESVVGVGLILLPWLTRWDGSARVFYSAAGAVILLVWARSESPAGASRSAA